MEDKTQIILGPPGTGKTTTLLGIVEECLQDDIQPEHICFVAFTRKAAQEAVARAAQRFNLSRKDLPLFRTLHSLAFRQLGYRQSEIMGFRDYVELARLLGIYITFKGQSEDGSLTGFSKGDRLVFTENLARVMDIPLRTLWEQMPDEFIMYEELEQYQQTLVKFKDARGKVDYTDMICEFNRIRPVPRVDVLIVDEAQDLTATQWKMVRILAEDAKRVYIAGDDDQAIFHWAGADVNHFIELKGESKVLDQSYRVPKNIAKVANEITRDITNRREKVWKPKEGEDGEVIWIDSLSEIDLREGTWLLLGRNAFVLEEYVDFALSQGVLFESRVGGIEIADTMQAIRGWELLRDGHAIEAGYIKKIYKLMSTKLGVQYGAKQKIDALPDEDTLTMEMLRRDYGLMRTDGWQRALDKLPEKERNYFATAISRGEKLGTEPRVRINTIHGVKGGEADNVVIMTDMAARTYAEYQNNPDDEARVWYVAVTRAKSRVYFMYPRTTRNYPLSFMG